MKAKFLCLILGLPAWTSVLADDAAVASREDVMKLIEISGLLTVASNRFAETTTLGVVRKLKFASTNDLDQAEIVVYQESQTLFREAAHRPGWPGRSNCASVPTPLDPARSLRVVALLRIGSGDQAYPYREPGQQRTERGPIEWTGKSFNYAAI